MAFDVFGIFNAFPRSGSISSPKKLPKTSKLDQDSHPVKPDVFQGSLITLYPKAIPIRLVVKRAKCGKIRVGRSAQNVWKQNNILEDNIIFSSSQRVFYGR